jgi:hypothetical protein
LIIKHSVKHLQSELHFHFKIQFYISQDRFLSSIKMQFTQIFTILAVVVAGVIAVPGGHGPPPPPPPPPAKPTSVVQQVLYCCVVTLLRSSNSGVRFNAMATPTHSAALQLKLRDIPARVLLIRLSTAMELRFAATATEV